MAATLWQQAVLSAQQDINAVKQQIEAEKTHRHGPQDAKPPAYKFSFLTPPEQALVRRYAARIVPADARSGGATAAHVDEYIDFVLGHGEPDLQKTWREGLQRYSMLAGGKTDQQLDDVLLTLSRHEQAPKTPNERFFVILKLAVTEGFYTSQEGIQKELGYQGLGFLQEFLGCTHEKHEGQSVTPIAAKL